MVKYYCDCYCTYSGISDCCMASESFGKAKICGNDDMVEEIKNIYREARCKAIHEYQNGTVELYEKSKKLLHELILKCIDEGNTPDTKRILTENKTRK